MQKRVNKVNNLKKLSEVNKVKNYSNRLRQTELSKSIFRPNGPAGKNSLDDEGVESFIIVYTMKGTPGCEAEEDGFTLEDETNPLAYAKQVNNGAKTKYFVKANKYGHVYNPLGMYETDRKTKVNPRYGMKSFDYRQVSKEVFTMYLNFLNTKNNAWLLNAERSMF